MNFLLFIFGFLNSISMTFIPNPDYCALLEANDNFNRQVRAGKAKYTSPEYQQLQKRLLAIELSISSQEIIDHAAYMFPKVGEGGS